MEQEEETDRRVPTRRPVRMTVLFRLDPTDRSESLGRAVNISQGGLRLEVNRPYEVDTSLFMRFQLPGERKGIQAAARVRWVDVEDPKNSCYALGVEFTELPVEQREVLSAYLERPPRLSRVARGGRGL